MGSERMVTTARTPNPNRADSGIALFELQICEDYSRIAQRTDLAVRGEIVIGRSGVQCERL